MFLYFQKFHSFYYFLFRETIVRLDRILRRRGYLRYLLEAQLVVVSQVEHRLLLRRQGVNGVVQGQCLLVAIFEERIRGLRLRVSLVANR